MSDATNNLEGLQDQLINAIKNHAEINEIIALLDRGAIANHVAVMQAIEAHADRGNDTWLEALFGIQNIAEAWRLRQAADQAAYDLIDSIEQNDLDGVNVSLVEMADTGDDCRFG